MDLVVTFDSAQRIVTYNQYNSVGTKVSSTYEFNYRENGEVEIETAFSSSPKSYRWLLQDSLVHKIELLKGSKKKLKAFWLHTYKDDTLKTSVAKFNKDSVILYTIDYEYTDENLLLRQSVRERGKPSWSLVAKYDSEGNLTGYHYEDNGKARAGSGVSIERDSTDQVSTLSYQNRKGKTDHWVYEYNYDDKPLKCVLLNAVGEEKRRIDYQYDAEGNETKRTTTEKKKIKHQKDALYDEHGNLVSTHYYRRFMGDLDMYFYTEYKYDNNNRVVRKDYFNKDLYRRTRWDYEYILN